MVMISVINIAENIKFHGFHGLTMTQIFLVHQIIHDSLHDEIVEKLKKAYGQVSIGDPLDGKLYYSNPSPPPVGV